MQAQTRPRVEGARLARLEIVGGPERGRSFPLEGAETFTVGRSRVVSCPMPADGSLSRDHFQLIADGRGGLLLRDLGSTNGTFVNDRQVVEVELADLDLISAGESTLRVRFLDPNADPGPVPRSPEPASEPAPTADLSTAERPSLATTAPRIVCEGCGIHAPAGTQVAVDSGRASGPETIHWLCERCRSDMALADQPVPDYTTLRVLGRGAMGVVYLAHQNRTGRKVALKLIVPESAAASSAIERFLREMRVVSTLKHPNIVEWIDQGSHRGRLWFAMEYVDGHNLEAVAKTRPGSYPVNQACRMACQILKGLAHAHDQGFVHRDIKPENILLARNAEGMLEAKISDFGLAKNIRDVGLSQLTYSGEIRGTIPFMPPEQVLDFRNVQPSGDLYAAAATLYFVLTGDFIYDGVGNSFEIVDIVLNKSPIPIRSRRPEIPAGLAAVIDRGLSREPDDRFPDAASLRRALRPYC